MEERRDRRQYDAQLNVMAMMEQMGIDAQLTVMHDAKLTVMDKKRDKSHQKMMAKAREMGCQIKRVESKVKRIEKSIYVFMGMLVFINVLWFIPLMDVS